MASAFEKERQRSINAGLSALIERIVGAEKGEENFDISMEFCRSHVDHHRFGDTDSHSVTRKYEALAFKYRVHGHPQEADSLLRALERLRNPPAHPMDKYHTKSRRRLPPEARESPDHIASMLFSLSRSCVAFPDLTTYVAQCGGGRGRGFDELAAPPDIDPTEREVIVALGMDGVEAGVDHLCRTVGGGDFSEELREYYRDVLRGGGEAPRRIAVGKVVRGIPGSTAGTTAGSTAGSERDAASDGTEDVDEDVDDDLSDWSDVTDPSDAEGSLDDESAAAGAPAVPPPPTKLGSFAPAEPDGDATATMLDATAGTTMAFLDATTLLDATALSVNHNATQGLDSTMARLDASAWLGSADVTVLPDQIVRPRRRGEARDGGGDRNALRPAYRMEPVRGTYFPAFPRSEEPAAAAIAPAASETRGHPSLAHRIAPDAAPSADAPAEDSFLAACVDGTADALGGARVGSVEVIHERDAAVACAYALAGLPSPGMFQVPRAGDDAVGRAPTKLVPSAEETRIRVACGNAAVSHLSPGMLRSVLERFARWGSPLVRWETFARRAVGSAAAGLLTGPTHGAVVAGVGSAVLAFLDRHRASALALAASRGLTLAQLESRAAPLVDAVDAVDTALRSALLDGPAPALLVASAGHGPGPSLAPLAAHIVDALCDACDKARRLRLERSLAVEIAALLVGAVEPYLGVVDEWVSRGAIDDPRGEFFLRDGGRGGGDPGADPARADLPSYSRDTLISNDSRPDCDAIWTRSLVMRTYGNEEGVAGAVATSASSSDDQGNRDDDCGGGGGGDDDDDDDDDAGPVPLAPEFLHDACASMEATGKAIRVLRAIRGPGAVSEDLAVTAEASTVAAFRDTLAARARAARGHGMGEGSASAVGIAVRERDCSEDRAGGDRGADTGVPRVDRGVAGRGDLPPIGVPFLPEPSPLGDCFRPSLVTSGGAGGGATPEHTDGDAVLPASPREGGVASSARAYSSSAPTESPSRPPSEATDLALLCQRYPARDVLARAATVSLRARGERIGRAVLSRMLDRANLEWHLAELRGHFFLEHGAAWHAFALDFFGAVDSGQVRGPHDVDNAYQSQYSYFHGDGGRALTSVRLELVPAAAAAAAAGAGGGKDGGGKDGGGKDGDPGPAAHATAAAVPFALAVPAMFGGAAASDPSVLAARAFAAEVARLAAGELTPLSRLTMHYDVPPPLDIVVTPESLRLYNDVMRFLVQIKRCRLALVSLDLGDRRAPRTVRAQRAFLLRHDLLSFATGIDEFVRVRVASAQASHGDAILDACDLASLREAHLTFVRAARAGCLLTDKGAQDPVTGSILRILRLATRFCAVAPGEFAAPAGPVPASERDEISQMSLEFARFHRFLLTLLRVQKGTSELRAELMLRLNFNGVYDGRT